MKERFFQVLKPTLNLIQKIKIWKAMKRPVPGQHREEEHVDLNRQRIGFLPQICYKKKLCIEI